MPKPGLLFLRGWPAAKTLDHDTKDHEEREGSLPAFGLRGANAPDQQRAWLDSARIAAC
jgi:hypothetical protein